MSGSYGVAFPTSGNPYPAASSYRASSPVPQQQVHIQPGSTTYTATTLPDGRIQYNQFRAEARSYQTPQGSVHGIQWVPVNVSYEIPLNAQLAGPDFHASWSRSANDKEAQRALKEWQHEQEKRVRKEEKESAKRMKEWDKERREREKAEEKEFRRMQERDLQRGGRSRSRSRRVSDVGYGADLTYPAPITSGYTRARSRSRARRDSVGHDEITRAMAELAMEKDWTAPETDSRWREKERRGSNASRSRRASVNERPRRISTHEYERTRKTSGTPYPTATYLAGSQSAYGAPPSPGRAYSNRGSPYMGGGGLPASGVTGPVYPPGHIYAGKPIPGMQVGNVASSYRAPSPSPRRPPMPLLEFPACFTRPPSLAVPYTYFDMLMILPDLNILFQKVPLMPAVLAPHDVWHEDWVQCFEDLARTWVGKWPDQRKGSRKPSKLVSELIDVWNASFFSLRGVELILSRGRQRLSGPHAGRYDDRLGDSDDESDTISSVSSDSDMEDRYHFYGGPQTRHTASGNPWLTDSREARRAHKARKSTEKQKKRQRREREREKDKGSGYTIYLSCIGDGQPPRFAYPPVGYAS